MRANDDQHFLDNFYDELTLSNFNHKIRTEDDAIKCCQLSGLLPIRVSPPPHCPEHRNTLCKLIGDRTKRLGFSYVCSLQSCRKKLVQL